MRFDYSSWRGPNPDDLQFLKQLMDIYRNLLLQTERQKFLAEQWPRISATIQRLGLTPEELEAAAKRRSSSDGAQSKTAESKPRREER